MNTRQDSSGRWFRLIVGLALLCPITWAAATTTRVYQWRELEGVRVFSSVPPPKTVARYTVRDITTPTIDEARQARIEEQLAGDRARAMASAQESSAHSAADVARDALALVHARDAQQLGLEPLPGERLHNAGGGSRLTPVYFARQAALDEAVARAQANLDAAERARHEPLS